ncbi:MAG: MarR family transcriptional regulator [Pseudomonadota bacterium]
MNTTESDLMDRLLADWAAECPTLDAKAMAVIGRIIRLGRRYEKDAAEALRPFRLPYTDFDILATLRRNGAPYELTPGQLGDAVLLSSGAMTAALDRLQQAALITRHDSPTDRRIKTARLTPTGKRLSKKAAAARFATATAATTGLTERESEQLTRLLKKLTDTQ